jgi:hypothetical protein
MLLRVFSVAGFGVKSRSKGCVSGPNAQVTIPWVTTDGLE